MCPNDETPDGNQGPPEESGKWNSAGWDDVFFPEECQGPPVESPEPDSIGYDDMPAFEVYEGPPAEPPEWSAAGWADMPPAEEYQDPPVEPPARNSVAWEDVAFGRPEFVLPDFGPTINDAIVADEAIKEMRAKIPGFDILYEAALLELIIRHAPGNG